MTSSSRIITDTVSTLGQALSVFRQTINEALRKHRAVSPAMALRLARLYGNTPEFWLNVQRAIDRWEAERADRKAPARIRPVDAA